MTTTVSHVGVVRLGVVVRLLELNVRVRRIAVGSVDSEHWVVSCYVLVALLECALLVLASCQLTIVLRLLCNLLVEVSNLLVVSFLILSRVVLQVIWLPNVLSCNLPPVNCAVDVCTLLECNFRCVDSILTWSFRITLPECDLAPSVAPATIAESFEAAA